MDLDLIDHLIQDWGVERPDLDASSMHIVGRLLFLGKKLERRASVNLKEIGINYTDLDVLATLRRKGAPYGLSPKELMQSVLITSGALTTLIDRLERLGLIYRAPDIKDGRVKKVVLTDAGKELIDRAIEVRFAEASDAIKSLSQQEKEILIPILKKLLSQIIK
ncbi:MarR family winged helix-turn-helix transcriptional regulator [Winogradskyella sp.]|uniref:MarR family winged helix-turn-helix transcriptional regulator n=1 Tax=Winogradskyella sp. TaxID=1883156 RepID=UPI002626F231|nr:MarR family transcriptional regulator [Winogradskyella sp.]